MRLTKRVQRTLLASAVAVLAFGAAPAMASTPFGNCVGADTSGGGGKDCTAGTGHASVSVVKTLSVNEMRALSFGNIAATTPANTDTIVLNLDGTRTISAGFSGLHGAQANDGAGGSAGNVNSGGQSPGHYTITGDAEGAATQVYISFADSTGAPIDMCDGPETGCDSYNPGNKVTFTGGELTLDHFFFNQSGSDVYGHYIVNAGNVSAGPPPIGTSTPWAPGHASTGGIDVVVGGTLHSDGTALTVGKHVGTFNIMASY